MAELNEDFCNVTEKCKIECGMYLQACLTNDELKTLKEKWREAGGVEVIPLWEYALENIKVSL